MSASGRIALVTGGGRGIGRGISLGLAEDGAVVAVNYRRDEEAARETVAAIEAAGGRAMAVAGSVADPAACEEIVASVRDTLGEIDILVNNAGVASRGNRVADTEPDEPLRLLGIHALGPFHLCRAVLPGMRTRPRGDVVFVSSSATRSMPARSAPYNMAKAAMEALALTLAKEERRHGIGVNVVAPGLVVTDMGKRLVKAGGVDDIAEMDALAPFGRVCRPDDIAAVVRWLVSDGARFVTAEKIYVDGGGP